MNSHPVPRLAAILAGGRATRLRGVMDDKPKCLAEIGGIPFIRYQLALLRKQGIREVVLLLGYKSEQVQAYVRDGSSVGMTVRHSVEPAPLGTAGAAKHAEAMLNEPFFLLNGDTLVDVDLAALAATHVAKAGARATLSLCQMDDISDYGSVDVNEEQRVLGFREKEEQARPGLVNAGVYLFEPAIFRDIPANAAHSVEVDLMPSLVEQGTPVYGHPFRGQFVDIGTPQRLEWAQNHPLFARLADDAR